ncbi:MAG: Gfo/Idh/MocA family oxidoreductase [Candidatus Omnitrophica bacterium]|nr:Gfo/Idh/MocA family oxidoreductase [Candidatus Omnitrophota bacterium]
MKKVKVGLVGAGGMGRIRARWLAENVRVVLSAVCDSTEEAKAITREYQARFYSDYRKFLREGEFEAVILSVPNRWHFSMAIEALDTYRHVLVEYPIALTINQAEQMLTLAKKKGLILHPGHTMRFEAQHLATKENLSRIGRMIFATGYIWYGREMSRWYGDPVLRGDTFTFLNYHHVDQFRDLFGRVEWLEGVLDERKNESGKLSMASGTIMLKFVNGGCAFSLQGHGILAPSTASKYIVGEKGYLEFKGTEGQGGLFLLSEKQREEINFPQNDPYKIDTDNFVREILGEQKILVPPEEALETLRICQLAVQSAREGRRIYV